MILARDDPVAIDLQHVQVERLVGIGGRVVNLESKVVAPGALVAGSDDEDVHRPGRLAEGQIRGLSVMGDPDDVAVRAPVVEELIEASGKVVARVGSTEVADERGTVRDPNRPINLSLGSSTQERGDGR